MNASATPFDAASGAAAAALYVAVAIAVLARAPRDSRARVFLAIAVCAVVPYMLPALILLKGPAVATNDAFVLAAGLSMVVGSLALFHFTQIFPARRPWIRAHGIWLGAGYVALPAAAAVGVGVLTPLLRLIAQAPAADSSAAGGVEGTAALGLLLVVIPTLFVAGLVLPFAALLSLFKSCQELGAAHTTPPPAERAAGGQAAGGQAAGGRAAAPDGARQSTIWVLVSQLAGGALTILVVPLLHVAAPTSVWVTIASVLLFGFGLLFPIAFAMGVWKYRLLDPN